MNPRPFLNPALRPSRRELLNRAAGGFGALALAGIFADLAKAEGPAAAAADPLAPRIAQTAARAKSVIFIFASGGASHTDTFDYKPKLDTDAGKTIAAVDFAGMGT